MARSNASREISWLLRIVVAVVVIAALYVAKDVFLPLALAVLFAFLLSPIVVLMEKVRVPRMVAILISILAVVAVLCAIGWAVANQLLSITNHLPAYRANITAKIQELHHTGKGARFSQAENEIVRLGDELGFSTANPGQQQNKPLGSSAERPIEVKEVSSTTGATLGALPGVMGNLVEALLVVVFTFFILLQREDLRNRLIRLTGRGALNAKTQVMDEANHRISRYFLLLLAVNSTYGTVIFTALTLLRLPHALLFGALTALLRFIPYIGAPVSGLLPIILSLAVFPGWEQAGIIFLIFLCMEIVTANYVEPRLYGKHTGVSPLAVLIAAVFWTLIWGPIGLLLSIPLTVSLTVIGSHVPRLKFLTVLLGDEPVLEPAAHFYQRLLAEDTNEARAVLENYIKDKPLEDLYDSVVIPALVLAEQDRHQCVLDDTTISFINSTTRDLVEDLGFRDEKNGEPAAEGASENAVPGAQLVLPRNIVCMPVRDDSDAIAAMMLAQLLERAGHFAQALPIRKLDEILADLSRLKPDTVYLSAVPPYATSNARLAYRKLRSQQPHLDIVIGVWNYTDDPLKAAKEISRGEQDRICITLAQAVAQAGSSPPTVQSARQDVQDQSVPA